VGSESVSEARLRGHFEARFRGLQLADIKHANDHDVRMGTFQLCAAFLDALALTYSAPPPKIKGGDSAKWDTFVHDFFPQPKYASLTGAYGSFRSLLLHNFSASRLAFIHGHPELHLSTHGELRILNRESFVAEVDEAFERFYAAVMGDADLRARALKHLDKHPPIGVWFLDPQSGPPPVPTAAYPYQVPLSHSSPIRLKDPWGH
jgi:hypothetical protein